MSDERKPICYGIGRPEARRDVQGAARDAAARVGGDTVCAGLDVEAAVVHAFCAWYRRQEQQAVEDREAAGGRGHEHEQGGPETVPLSQAQRLTCEVPHLLRAIMANPLEVLAALDTGRGLVV